MAAQELDADRVERAKPRHALDGAADQKRHALLHLAGRLVGEGDGEDLAGIGAAGGENMSDARGQHPGLAGAGAGQHQNRTVEAFDGVALFRVQAGQVVGRRGAAEVAGRHGARGDAAQRRASVCSVQALLIGCRGRASGRDARRRFFIEERNIVETIAHGVQCSDSDRKDQKRCSAFILKTATVTGNFG